MDPEIAAVFRVAVARGVEKHLVILGLALAKRATRAACPSHDHAVETIGRESCVTLLA